jgi:hypothetical protein
METQGVFAGGIAALEKIFSRDPCRPFQKETDRRLAFVIDRSPGRYCKRVPPFEFVERGSQHI